MKAAKDYTYNYHSHLFEDFLKLELALFHNIVLSKHFQIYRKH